MSKFDAKREELLSEVRDILTSAEALFDEKSKASADDLKKLKANLNSRFEQAKAYFSELQEETTENAKQVAKQADALVQDNPYKAITVAGVIGLLLGLLVSKR
ncbi:ElaB/YqjD/DUF883 family membrane-anchored ribosome-binding protein [Nicoletella semolina]|uniref:ElaB/YqjD/DUF883 family membrane-anchored ribosome-binding protein n=1 Tax=Nicoletella semolina TaxID=271160 RepID=A0A4R2NA60_9PAST|nr:DUF883 family protein [Nicoletella semolina]MDH2925393.1 hypothetical protein [Nicoletella semolina]TCP17872.1 ElaB/YqjD/DUF883 family membrane-anchored ribosome-binding protein [Nicoletella semolina]